MGFRINDAHQQLHARVAARIARANGAVALRCWLGWVVLAAAKWRWKPIDCGQETEVIETVNILQFLNTVTPRLGAHSNPNVVARFYQLVDNCGTKRAANGGNHRVTRSVNHWGCRSFSGRRQLVFLAFRLHRTRSLKQFLRRANAHPCLRS